MASVELLNINTGLQETLTNEPHFARRVWYLDHEVVIWGDQGAQGQAFVALNTELLWVDWIGN